MHCAAWFSSSTLTDETSNTWYPLLPPAYGVRGKVMFWQASILPSIHLSVHRGGVPISHNALQHFPECHEAAGGVPGPPPGGVPGQVPPPGGGTRTPRGGYPVRYPPGGYPAQVPPPGGYPAQVPPRGGTRLRYPPPRGGTWVGQQKEYSLHGGRYASCVHAGGLSCSWLPSKWDVTT